MAPIIKFQARQKMNNWLSKATREKMVLRDLALETASKYHQIDDWRLYRRLKNKCNKLVKIDRSNHFKSLNEVHMKNNDSASLFKLSKNRMNIKTGGQPTAFLIGGKMITAPRDVANVQIDFFQKKIEDLIKNLPNEGIDPLLILKNALIRWGAKTDARPKFLS